MRINPVTEEQAEKSARGYLLKPGECEFEVRNAEEQTSSTGNPMIKLTLDVWDADSKQAVVFDYLLDAMPHKVRHFAYAVGMGHIYEEGDLPADACVGKGGRLLIRTKQQRGYEPKNDVADYVVTDKAKQSAGYQNAKATHSKEAAPPAAPRQVAWKAFCAKTSQFDSDARNNAWREAVTQYFGHNDQGSIRDEDWTNFSVVVRQSWQAGKGIPMGMRVRQPVTSPIDDTPEFTDDSIPF